METPDLLPNAGSKYEHGVPIAAFEGLHLREQRIVATYPGYVTGGAVLDPLTMSNSKISTLHPVDWELHFSQEMQDWKMTWGLDLL